MDELMLMDDILLGYSGGGMPLSTEEKTKKPKHDNWFASCKDDQLTTLCKAAKLPVSGSKSTLVQRLMGNKTTKDYQETPKSYLKGYCNDKQLIMYGTKCDLILRLLYYEFETGTAKRVATETIIGEDGKEVQVAKKRRKSIFKPESLYKKIKQKIHTVKQKKFQTHCGSKNHSQFVYGCLNNLLKDQCVESGLMDSDPVLAFSMAKALLKGFGDHFPHMEQPGYGTSFFSDGAMGQLEIILKETKSHLSSEQIAKMVDLLESVEAVTSGHCLAERTVYSGNTIATQNCFEEVIKVICPEYEKESHPRKKDAALHSAISDLCWTIGSGRDYQDYQDYQEY